MSISLPPLSLYIHIPWCIKKCPYCDFNSHVKPNALPEEEYIQALKKDLAQDLEQNLSLTPSISSIPLIQEREIISLFFGGGTPSLFSPKSIEKIIHHFSSILNFSSSIEITLEANPGTLEHYSFEHYVSAGINRISLGVQSFQDEKLRALGRIHSHQEVEKALNILQNIPSLRFNIDLMYGLPNQSLEDALYDLETAMSFNPTHLSWYNLTIEPNTIFYSKPPILPPSDDIAEMQDAGFKLLKKGGFMHYEVSAFAKEDHFSKHNLNYWEFGDYLGIGAGAHSKITHYVNNQYVKNQIEVRRYEKKKLPSSYLKGDFVAQERLLTNDDLIFEFMLNALRLNQGFAEQLFEERTGLSFAMVLPIIKIAENQGLLMYDGQWIRPTSLGQLFLNDLMALFLPKS